MPNTLTPPTETQTPKTTGLSMLREGRQATDPNGFRGTIREVYYNAAKQPIGVKVAFAVKTPYLDDWSIFQPHELTLETATNHANSPGNKPASPTTTRTNKTK